MSELKRMFMSHTVNEEDIDRLYHGLIDASMMVIKFDSGIELNSKMGICSLVRRSPALFGEPYANTCQMLKAVFRTWSKYSGKEDYPVPHPTMDASRAYEFTINLHDHMAMWDRLTPYGANRRELLIHCINEVSKLRLEIQKGLKPYPINR